MEVIDDFFKKEITRDKIRDLLISINTFEKDRSLPVGDIEEKYLDLILRELEDVPEKITTNLEEYPICGFYTSDSTIRVKVGKKTLEIEPNSLAIPTHDISIRTQDELILIFLVNNPKWGYKKNLLAQFSLNGISQLLPPILSELNWRSLSNLYRNNPAILTLLQKSPKFWDDYWLKTYGSTLPENSWKTLVQLGDEIAQTNIQKKSDREFCVLIKYNADLMLKKRLKFGAGRDDYSKYLILAYEYDSLEVLKYLEKYFSKRFVPPYQELLRRGIGRKCLNYLLQNDPKDEYLIINIAYRGLLRVNMNREMIIYMLETYPLRARQTAAGKKIMESLYYLRNKKIDLFLKSLLEVPDQAERMTIIETGFEFVVELNDLLFLFATPKYYEKISKRLSKKIVTPLMIQGNPNFSEWLLQRGFLLHPIYLGHPILTRRVFGVLERSGYKKMVEVLKMKEWKVFELEAIYWSKFGGHVPKDSEIKGKIEDIGEGLEEVD